MSKDTAVDSNVDLSRSQPRAAEEFGTTRGVTTDRNEALDAMHGRGSSRSETEVIARPFDRADVQREFAGISDANPRASLDGSPRVADVGLQLDNAGTQRLSLAHGARFENLREEVSSRSVRGEPQTLETGDFRSNPGRVAAQREFAQLALVGTSIAASPSPAPNAPDPSNRPVTASRKSADVSVVPEQAEETGFWGSLWEKTKNVGYTIGKAAYNLSELNYKIITNIPTAIAAVGRGIGWAATHPAEVWQGVCNAGATIRDVAIRAASAVADGVVYAVTHPIEALKATGSFLYSVGENLGLVDIWNGNVSQMKGIYYLCTGDFAQAKQCFIDSAVALRGACVAAGEFLGVSAGCRCVSALARGDYVAAGLEGADCGFAIVGLCTTGGLANAGRMAATGAVKALAKEAGEQIAKQAVKAIGSEVVKETGEAIAKESLQQITTQIAKIGAGNVTESTVKAIVKETAEKQTVQLLKNAGVESMVETTVVKMLQDSSSMATKELAQKLTELGMSGSANYSARMLQRALSNGAIDETLKKAITKEITDQIKHELFENGMKESFEKTFQKGMKEIAGKHGLDAKKLIRAGVEGFEEGVEAGVMKVVREGVDKAFRKFREDDGRQRPYQAPQHDIFAERVHADDRRQVVAPATFERGRSSNGRSATRRGGGGRRQRIISSGTANSLADGTERNVVEEETVES